MQCRIGNPASVLIVPEENLMGVRYRATHNVIPGAVPNKEKKSRRILKMGGPTPLRKRVNEISPEIC